MIGVTVTMGTVHHMIGVTVTMGTVHHMTGVAVIMVTSTPHDRGRSHHGYRYIT